MASIHFNDRYSTLLALYWYNGSSYTQRGSSNNPYNCDLFPDTGVAVGHAILFQGQYNEENAGKYNELKINLDVGVAATTWDGVWEYASGGTYNAPTWTPLSGVTDGSNKLRNTGATTLTFTVPTNWTDFHSVGTIYGWTIRFRVTSVSGLTEGGHVANSSNCLQVKPYSIHLDTYTNPLAPLTFTDIYNASVAGGWGVVAKDKNVFTFSCNLNVITSAYLTSKSEVVVFNENNIFCGSQYGIYLNVGEIVIGTKVRFGSKFIFYGRQGNYPSTAFLGTGATLLGFNVEHIIDPSSYNCNGYWGFGIGDRPDQTIVDMDLTQWRHLSFNSDQVYISGVTGRGSSYSDCHIETGGAVMERCTIFGGYYCMRPNGIAADFIGNSDLSGATESPFNPWQPQRFDGYVFRAVDCYWGTFADTKKFRTTNAPTISYTNPEYYEAYSILIRAIDEQQNPLAGATMVIKNKNGNTIYNITANADGYFGEDSGTLTYAEAAYYEDNTKTSWTPKQWTKRRVLMTSGGAIGISRLLKTYYAGTTYYRIVPGIAMDVTPAIGDRYIMIPQIDVKAYVPKNHNPGATVWATVTDNGPFTIEIRANGFAPYYEKINIAGNIDKSVTLLKVKDLNFSKKVKMRTQ